MTIVVHAGDPDKALRQQREFYELLGRTISTWTMVEDQIYHTCRVVIDARDWVAFAAAYHAVVNMNTRLEMIEAAISCSTKHNQHLEAWTILQRKIRRHAGRRNRLAHWTVVQSATKPEETGCTMYLEPPTYNFAAKRDESGKPETITVAQIGQWASGFVGLMVDVEKFWRGLEGSR